MKFDDGNSLSLLLAAQRLRFVHPMLDGCLCLSHQPDSTHCLRDRPSELDFNPEVPGDPGRIAVLLSATT